jgi:S1-C subfamily serine protease
MSRAAIPILFATLLTAAARGDEPTETRSQALLGVLGDVLADGQGFRVDGLIEDGPATRLTRPDNPKAVGQLLEGDTVVRIDGKKFGSWRQWYDRLNVAYRAGKGTVRITVRTADGRESEWLVQPAVTDVDVPLEGVPLIAVPDLDPVPDPVFPKVRDLPAPKK